MVKLWDFETSKLNKIKKQFSKYLITEGSKINQNKYRKFAKIFDPFNSYGKDKVKFPFRSFNNDRVDRSFWSYDLIKMYNQEYIDCHSLRPYNKYEKKINDLIRLI
jgi:hypothetical protein